MISRPRRLRYTSTRYDTEARLNQAIASIYELQVRQNNYSAEKHHRRSAKFFYGMLATQMAVIISTFAIAARQQNFLWSIAAAAGTAAVALCRLRLSLRLNRWVHPAGQPEFSRKPPAPKPASLRS